MAPAFISYAHEDQEFMLSLVDRLQGQGHEIRRSILRTLAGLADPPAEVTVSTVGVSLAGPD